MKYVVDASIGFKWEVAELHSDKAQQLRDDFRNAVHELLAPDLFPTEVANALLVAERRGDSSQAKDRYFSPTCSLLFLESILLYRTWCRGPTSSLSWSRPAFMIACMSPWPSGRSAS